MKVTHYFSAMAEKLGRGAGIKLDGLDSELLEFESRPPLRLDSLSPIVLKTAAAGGVAYADEIFPDDWFAMLSEMRNDPAATRAVGGHWQDDTAKLLEASCAQWMGCKISSAGYDVWLAGSEKLFRALDREGKITGKAFCFALRNGFKVRGLVAQTLDP